MHEPNVARVLERIRPTSTVLDIGGWARPFNRANWVVDAEPWDTRGYYGAAMPAQGSPREHFTASTWIQRDLCQHTPLPFADQSIDYVICSHVLEDIRDPLWVCAEMRRVARAGYIEVPSREVESCRGIEPGQVGWSHHRWLIDMDGSHVTFLMKYHMIHAHWRFSLPARHLRALPATRHVQWLFWEGDLTWSERTIHGTEAIAEELAGYVRSIRPYARGRVALDRVLRRAGALPGRAWRGLRRRLGG